jgi:predicted glycoside hydrolase/deacetylase ChbG (UPF0249 family)
MKRRPVYLLFISFVLIFSSARSQQDTTYAERLGFPKGAKVIILHVDDAGMSFDSNKGAEEAMQQGIASSTSVMMPCPWVPGFVHFLHDHPEIDAGLHLTLTSEWKDYRWGPVAGKSKVPGLTDPEGAMWRDVPEVIGHATPDEVETEIRAQVERALQMGFHPTHLDSHMGTLFALPAYTERYVKIGIEYKIPVMFPGGHNTLIKEQIGSSAAVLEMTTRIGRMLWNAGLPVLDDLHNLSYAWMLPPGTAPTPANWAKFKTDLYISSLRKLKPGVTMVIMHCTDPGDYFKYITDTGPTRQGDLNAMLSPELKDFIAKEGIIITTWRELKQRRDKLKK